MTLVAENLGKTFGEQTVLCGVNITARPGETIAIVGRSGCGKTTLLRLLAGFLQPDEGQVLLDGVPAGEPDQRRLMVFQSFDQLFPWFTLQGNLLFALRRTHPTLSRGEARRTIARCLAQMDLQEAAEKFPYQLSGGMMQRGALARAMAIAPRVLLLDEPFSSLDAVSREKAHVALAAFKAATGSAVVLVTHDLEEAAELATESMLLNAQTHTLTPVANASATGMGNRLSQLLRG